MLIVEFLLSEARRDTKLQPELWWCLITIHLQGVGAGRGI